MTKFSALLSPWRFVAFLQLFNKHYLSLFFTGIFISHPSWNSFWYILAGLLASQFLINIRMQFSSYASIIKMYESTLKKWIGQHKKGDKDIAVKRYSLAEYLGVKDTDELFKVFFVEKYHRLLFGGSDSGVRIYDIKNSGNDFESGKTRLPVDLVCFARPVGITYVFVKIAPDEYHSTFDKLKVYHEIGHYVVSPMFLKYRRTGGILMAMTLIYLIYSCTDIHRISWFAITAYFFLLLVIVTKWFFAWLPNHLRDEVYADLFSLYCLSDVERKELVEKFSTGKYRQYFNNPKMLQVQVNKRESIFEENLIIGIEYGRGAMYENTIIAIESPESYLLLRSIFGFFFFISLGLFAKDQLPFTTYQLWYSNLCLLLFFLMLVLLNNRSEKEADNAFNFFKAC